MVFVELAACDGFAFWKHTPPIDRPQLSSSGHFGSVSGVPHRNPSITSLSLRLIPAPRATGPEDALHRRMTGSGVGTTIRTSLRRDDGHEVTESQSGLTTVETP